MQYTLVITDKQYDDLMLMYYKHIGLSELKHLKFSKKLMLWSERIKVQQTQYITKNIYDRPFKSWELTENKLLIITP